MKPLNILILGASYGSLLGTKIVLAGHNVKMVCLPKEVELFNKEGAIIRMPIKGRDELIEIRSKDCSGKLSAGGPESINPAEYDLVVLAMQEPQYSSPDVGVLLQKVAQSKVPCMSIMNMPPPPFLKRFNTLNVDELSSCYKDSSLWDEFDPGLFTLCSPDPQAFRPPDEELNILQVRLPTNFKAARFRSDRDTEMLQRLQNDIENLKFTTNDNMTIELPVKLKVHDSIYVPLAKWAMLISGNYRCVQQNQMRPIKEAVHSNIVETTKIYEWVVDLCVSLGGDTNDFVSFEKYANAALSLESPSSAARALDNGATAIERVDKLVQAIALQNDRRLDSIDVIVSLVDDWLEKNQLKEK